MQKPSNDKLSKRIYLGALFGVFLEYVDYALYGFSAPYLAKNFFPSESPSVELVLSWAVFSVSFLARPFGAVIFGHLADTVGRRRILTYTILLMSIATILIGLLPTFQQLGIFASILLVACRILQGLAVSTEYSGCSTYLLEFKKDRPGLVSGIITSASGFGIFGASLLVLLFNSQSSGVLGFDSWRWPFIVGGLVVGILGVYFRRGLVESPLFLETQKQNTLVYFPFWYVLRHFPKTLIKGILISAYVGITIMVIEIYVPAYLQANLGVPKERALQFATYLSFMEAVFAILWGGFSDYLGRVRVFVLAGLLVIIGIFPVLLLLHHASVFLWLIAATALALMVAATDGPLAAFLTEAFPTEVRYTAVSVSYSLGAGVVGGLSPVFLGLLTKQSHTFGVISLYLVVAAFLMLSALGIKKSPSSRFHRNKS